VLYLVKRTLLARGNPRLSSIAGHVVGAGLTLSVWADKLNVKMGVFLSQLIGDRGEYE
jgi:hypothetical protein